MANLTWRFTQLAVVAATYGLVQNGPKSGFIASAGYLGCFIILYISAFMVWLIWSRVLTPVWLSPLNKLPQPKVGLLVTRTIIYMNLLDTGRKLVEWSFLADILCRDRRN